MCGPEKEKQFDSWLIYCNKSVKFVSLFVSLEVKLVEKGKLMDKAVIKTGFSTAKGKNKISEV